MGLKPCYAVSERLAIGNRALFQFTPTEALSPLVPGSKFWTQANAVGFAARPTGFGVNAAPRWPFE